MKEDINMCVNEKGKDLVYVCMCVNKVDSMCV